MTGFSFDNNRFAADTIRLPMMSLREVVMFPRSIAPLFVGREASIKAIEQSVAAHDKKIFWWPSAPGDGKTRGRRSVRHGHRQ